MANHQEVTQNGVVAIVPQKAGTHLLSRLFSKLGFNVFGCAVVPLRHAPKFSVKQRLWLLRKAFTFLETLTLLPRPQDKRDKAIAQRIAITSMAIFGEPIGSRHSRELQRYIERSRGIRKAEKVCDKGLLNECCYMQHSLGITSIAAEFLKASIETFPAKVFFMQRDPRDILLSFLDYLMQRSRRHIFGGFAEYIPLAACLNGLANDNERLLFLIENTAFDPLRDLTQSSWLRCHPMVCVVRFEDLIGPNGGGTLQAQDEAVQKIFNHLSCDKEVAVVRDELFSLSSYTFNKGKAERWRSVFTSQHTRAFDAKYPGLIERFGYKSH
jgi:hypothetical protein